MGPVARHLDAPARRGRHCRQRLLFTDRFSHRADMYTVTAAEFTAEGTANILINRYIPLWECPRSILSDNGLQFCSKLSRADQLLSVHKLKLLLSKR